MQHFKLNRNPLEDSTATCALSVLASLGVSSISERRPVNLLIEYLYWLDTANALGPASCSQALATLFS